MTAKGVRMYAVRPLHRYTRQSSPLVWTSPSTGRSFNYVNPVIVVNANPHGHHLPQQEVSGWWSPRTDTNDRGINNPHVPIGAIN